MDCTLCYVHSLIVDNRHLACLFVSSLVLAADVLDASVAITVSVEDSNGAYLVTAPDDSGSLILMVIGMSIHVGGVTAQAARGS